MSAIPQATGIALPPALDASTLGNPPNPQRALNIAVSAISNGINSAINTVQQSSGGGQVVAQQQAPSVAPAPALATAPSSIGAFLGSQAAAGAGAQGGGGGGAGPNTGAIVGGEGAAQLWQLR